MRTRKFVWGNFLLFALPTLFIFFTVTILPCLYGILLTFTNWNGIADSFQFVGIRNYIAVFQDKVFWSDFLLTLKYVFFTSLFSNLIAFLLAYTINTLLRGKNFYKVGFFTPNLIGGIILGYIWVFIFQRVLVYLGEATGMELFSASWLTVPDKAFWALVIVSVWQLSGFLMVIYAAGLSGIRQDLLEAASIDGCGGFQRLKYIVTPLMVSSFTICIFLSLQRTFMVYDLNLSLTNGGDPYNTTELISMHVYNKAFASQQYGVGQSEAFFLFLMVAAATGIQVYLSKKMEVES